MKKILYICIAILLFYVPACLPGGTAFAVTGDVSVEGQLDVYGNIIVGTSETGTVGALKELVLRQDGDTYGPSILRLRNRNGENGAIYETTDATITLIDFIFKTGNVTAGQRNIRLEARDASARTGTPSFHIGGGAAGAATPDDPTLSVGDLHAAIKNKLTIGAYPSTDATVYVYDNTTATEPLVRIEQAGTGDSALRFYHSAATAQSAAIGLDQNDNKNLKISNTTGLTGTTYADTNTMMRIHTETGSQGIIDFNHQSRARAYRNAAQNIANTTWTKIQLNTENYDEKAEFDNATNYRFTALEDGYYQVNGAVRFSIAAAAANTACYCAVYKNGTAYAYGSTAVIRGTPQISVVSDVVQLDAGQYVELWIYQAFGAAQNTTAGTANTFMSVHKIH